ncbi:Maf family protein [Patescibacteria group bacterium]|nr:Maf family protein [Patescibacteria group bacterium]
MKIILGSQSFWRKKVLESMGYDFEVMIPRIDEKAIRDEDPKQLVLKIGRAKAEALLPKIKEDAILITSDQVGVCDGEIREKPENEAEVRKFLQSYEKYPVQTVTSVITTNTKTGKTAEGIDIAKLWFSKFSDDQIEKIAKDKVVYTFAGGYNMAYADIADHVIKIEGTIDSVQGLPIELTKKLIKQVS